MTDTLPEQAPICVACVGDGTNPNGGPCLRLQRHRDRPGPAGADRARGGVMTDKYRPLTGAAVLLVAADPATRGLTGIEVRL